MIKTQYFSLQELVHPDIFKARGERAWELLQVPAILTLDQLRTTFGPLVVNTWHSEKLQKLVGGKVRVSSGLRPFNDDTGAKFSQHKFGNAFDCLALNYSAEEMRKYVLANADEFPYLTAIEDGVSWFHFDCRNCKRITVFKP